MFLEREICAKEQEFIGEIIENAYILKLAYLVHLFSEINQLISPCKEI
jgi:hypothetical protein